MPLQMRLKIKGYGAKFEKLGFRESVWPIVDGRGMRPIEQKTD